VKFIKKSISQESSVFLNLIRLFACELVVLGHFLTRYQPAPGGVLFTLGSTMGGVAVLLFFVLSGLLISYSLHNKLDNSGYRFRSFFVDRFSRIYSGLLPALAVGTVIAVTIYATNYSYFMQLCTMQSTPSPLNFGLTLGMLEQRFPVAFFNSLPPALGISFAIPDVTPFGFNGILWTLVLEWWMYMVFGWLVIGSFTLIRKEKRSTAYKGVFLVVAAFLSLVLIGMFQQSSSFVIVWFVGVLMMLAVSSESLNSKFSSPVRTRLLAVLFALSLAIAGFVVYATFAWTKQYYEVSLGLPLALFVFIGILLFNNSGFSQASKLIMNKRFVHWTTLGAGFSYTLFLTHYPIIIFFAGLNLPINRFIMLLPILLITNITAFCIAYFTERKHKEIARAIKGWLLLEQF
jgi:peptidoglycan/LPS O-acetylase OafA/YrhL